MKMFMFLNKFNMFKLGKSMINLPTPVNISGMWNFGSLLGIFLMVQLVSGLFLSMHYCPNFNLAFDSVIGIMHDVNYGWFMRLIHMNGASFFFFFMFIHIGRGLYYGSYVLMGTWIMGSMILLISMGTAFLGYVLPWGQMSFWGATVITNLLSAVPYMGDMMVMWLWGGFSINNATLNRFYSLHFILPFIIMVMVLIHLMFLHNTGSSNPIGVNSNLYKITFHMYFTYKDIVGFYFFLLIFLLICCYYPYMLGDPENFNLANSLVTPVHIQPEWYFLFAYAILRSISNKLGGVLALLLSVLIIMILPFMISSLMQGFMFYPINQIFFWILVNIFILLTWVGMKPIEDPYLFIGQILTLLYFSYFMFNNLLMSNWDINMYIF